jgi:hypothetical protein
MEVTRTTVAIVAAACLTAGAAAGYLVTRDPSAAGSVPADTTFAADAEAVEATEGSVIEAPETASAAPTPVVTPPPAASPATPRPAAPAPRPVPREEPRTVAAPTPAPAPPVPAPSTAPTEIVNIAPAVIEPVRPAFESEPIPAEPPGPEYHELILAADSVIGLQVETAVSSETATIEDPVMARVTRDVKVGDQVAIPAGSKARGEVTLVERGGKMKERARLGVRFTSIVLADGTEIPINSQTVIREGDAPGRESAAKIGGGAIGGAIIGGILGGARGVAIGSAIGGGAGSAAVMAGGRNPATLSPGSPVTVRLEQPATVTVEK